MFGIGLPEMILILALALIVVGPDKLPDLARSVAKGVLELKKTVSSLKDDLAEDNPFDSVKPELEEAADLIRKQLGEATPDGFTGIVKDLEEGIQEVIDTNGTVIPVDTDDIIKIVAESDKPEPGSDGDPAAELKDQAAQAETSEPEIADQGSESDIVEQTEDSEEKASPSSAA